jgi:Tfp pilus assembly protein PilN
MIKVNLVGASRKKPKVSTKITLPTNATPIVLGLIVLGSVAFGYWWYATVTGEYARLENEIQAAQTRKAQLDAVIKQDQIFETRKKALENRVKIIEDLQNNQVSPVVALDVLSQAIDRTQYVWLNTLDQNNAVFTMSGLGTSLLAIADLYTNLQATGYFKNIDVSNAQDTSGNFTFALKCEFSPPPNPAPSNDQPEPVGGN